jgi:polyferredoxin
MSIERAPKAPRTAARVIRWTLLSAVLITVTVLGVLHQKLGIDKPVGVDALCPFGGLETLGALVTSGTLIQRVALSSVLLLGAAVITAFVFRRVFCGRICPLGFLQELAGGLGKRLFGRRLQMPAALDRPARYLKYLVLAALLGLSWSAASLVVRPYDPWVAYNHLSSAEVFTDFGIGLAVLVIALVGSLLYDRFFCKYACPMGAFLGLISRFSLFRVSRNAETCIECGVCDKACPVNVNVSKIERMTSPECIDCGECTAACPVADTLAVRGPSTTSLSPVASGALAVGTFAALVIAATATGSFEWTVPALGDQIAEATGSGSAASSAATFDTTLIKGSTTLQEVIDATAIPADVFTRVYGVPASEGGKQLKELKTDYGCSPGELRAFIEAYREDPSAADAWVVGAFEESEEH